jgi:peptidoglycan/LPS O-acetylase OafA/YrhL
MTIQQTEQQSDRVLALDGFRGLAVLMVTLYRFGEVSMTDSVVGKWASKAVYLGASGVDLFFVLSGFLITGILLEQKGSSRYFSTFYARRALRIFPLYFASLICFLWVLPWFGMNSILTGDTIAGSTKEITGNTLNLWLYTTNLSIAWANEWHFGALDHFWSLAIEEQFYLVWPLVVLLLSRRKLLWACLISCSLVAVCRISFSFATDLEVTSKTFTVFRVDGLLLGASAAIAFQKNVVYSDRTVHWIRVGVLALGALFAATLILGQNDHTIRYTIVSLAGTLILLSTLSSDRSSPERMAFEHPILRSLGKYSYAMYIFQLPLIPLMAPWISPSTCELWCGNRLLGAFIYVIVMFAITYALSVLSWYVFESRFLALREKRFRNDTKRSNDFQQA